MAEPSFDKLIAAMKDLNLVKNQNNNYNPRTPLAPNGEFDYPLFLQNFKNGCIDWASLSVIMQAAQNIIAAKHEDHMKWMLDILGQLKQLKISDFEGDSEQQGS